MKLSEVMVSLICKVRCVWVKWEAGYEIIYWMNVYIVNPQHYRPVPGGWYEWFKQELPQRASTILIWPARCWQPWTAGDATRAGVWGVFCSQCLPGKEDRDSFFLMCLESSPEHVSSVFVMLQSHVTIIYFIFDSLLIWRCYWCKWRCCCSLTFDLSSGPFNQHSRTLSGFSHFICIMNSSFLRKLKNFIAKRILKTILFKFGFVEYHVSPRHKHSLET